MGAHVVTIQPTSLSRPALGRGRLALIGAVLLGLWGAAAAQQGAPPPPQGVEVMTRGPVHEAFATPTVEAKPTMTVGKQPPAPLDELPPDERPEGDVVWIAGYWAWDDDRTDYLWVSGCWRTKPPGKEWVAGYWREADTQQWQWVPGFWHSEPQQQQQPVAQGQPPQQQDAGVTYYPAPPAPPNVAPPGKPPQDDVFYVPGYWQWNGTAYAWRSGFWTRVQPGYVWVASHYRWTPSGYVFIPGYWDIAVARRGMLYAPVVVDYRVVPATYVYTPAYAVSDTLVMDTMFVRPCACHYYFGDYYEPRYRALGYESSYVYSTRNYDSIVVYRTYEYRSQPDYVSIQINLFGSRSRGEAPVPPRTLAQQTTIINNYNTTVVNNTTINKTVNNVNNNVNNNVTNNQFQMVAPAKQVAAAKGMTTVPVDTTTRYAAKQAAQTTQLAAVTQRKQAEHVPPGSSPKAPAAPRVAALKVPPTKSAASLPSATHPHGLQAPNPGVHQQPAGHLNNVAGTVNPNVKPNTAVNPGLQNTRPGLTPNGQPLSQPNQQKTGTTPPPRGTTPPPQQRPPVVTQPPPRQNPPPPQKKDEKDKKKQPQQ